MQVGEGVVRWGRDELAEGFLISPKDFIETEEKSKGGGKSELEAEDVIHHEKNPREGGERRSGKGGERHQLLVIPPAHEICSEDNKKIRSAFKTWPLACN